MRRILYWILMNIKRLYKKPTFIAVLALVPIAVLALSAAAEQQSGFIHIVLASHSEKDRVANEVIDEFLSESSIVRFSRASTPEEALRAGSGGDADEAWIFSDNADKRLEEYSSTSSSGEAFVTVVGREENVFLGLAREKLAGALYKRCAEAHYISFARNSAEGRLDMLSDEELMRYFDDVNITEELFVFGEHGGQNAQEKRDGGYITAPVRGLLGVLCTVCGLAAAMYYLDDEKRGAFSRVPENRRIPLALAAVFVAVINIAAASLVSMKISGAAVSVGFEIILALAYSLCVSCFCLLLMSLLGSNKLIGPMILPISVVMIAVCPVFFDFRAFLKIQLLFPPTYYVNSVYDARYVLFMLIYALICLCLCLIIDKCRKLFKTKI